MGAAGKRDRAHPASGRLTAADMKLPRILRRAHIDAECERDLRFHLEAETEENIARGMTPDQARDAARRKLGNPTLIREEVYRMNTSPALDAVWRDLRSALRSMRQSPAFAITAIVTLAIGIGVNTAMFTIIRAVLLNPLQFRDP